MSDEQVAQSLGEWQVVPVADGDLRPSVEANHFEDPVSDERGLVSIDGRPPGHEPDGIPDEPDTDRTMLVGTDRSSGIGSWPALAAGLSVILLCAMGAIIWLLAADRTSGTTSVITGQDTTVPTIAQSLPPSSALEADGQYQQSDLALLPPPPPDPAAADRLQRELDRTIGDNPITFEPGRADLGDLQMAFIENTVAGLIDTFRGGVTVAIIGYDDVVAQPDRALAIKRAQAVEKVILRTGVPPFVLVTEGRTQGDDADHVEQQGRVKLEVIQQ